MPARTSPMIEADVDDSAIPLRMSSTMPLIGGKIEASDSTRAARLAASVRISPATPVTNRSSGISAKNAL